MTSPTAPAYAELQVTSNYSFLRGASHPSELVETADMLGLSALGLTDRNSLAGLVRAHVAARGRRLRFLPGCRLDLQDAPSLLVYPTDRAAYGRLCRLLTLGKRRAEKGACHLWAADLDGTLTGQQVIALADGPPTPLADWLLRLRGWVDPGALSLAAHHLLTGEADAQVRAMADLAAATGVPLVAVNDVHYHRAGRRRLQDVLTCIREGCRIDEAGLRLFPNAERHLKSPADMAVLFRAYPQALARTLEISDACRFDLDSLRYEYPEEPIPPSETAQSYLERLTWEKAAERYPAGVPDKVQALLRRELTLIERRAFAPYFLTVHDIVAEAARRGILCQGRGSAANSAVCFVLGITAVDPNESELLFDRFISEAREEPPDIDVDFEHERREEIIQYLYQRYGRDRAGLAATVITYRGRSAIGEVGKVMGLSEDTTRALAGLVWGSYGTGVDEDQVRRAGFDPHEPHLAETLRLAADIIGFPRHLSQHVGGFVLTRGLLEELVPIGNAAMPNRSFIEWDKDDIDALKIMKVDILALGMLSCIRRAFALIARHHGRQVCLATVPRDDPAVYDMLCRADSIGVFQVESRAQMNMLPRLKPRCFYDLVIQVAIVRPGPIQGNMVHPYLRRRDGLEPVLFPPRRLPGGAVSDNELAAVLGRTLGVPLFQEQAIRIAQVAAEFSAEDVNALRYAMATFRRRGRIETLEARMVERMVARGYDRNFAQRCFDQIKGFGEYGFPESHAASFARLVYISAWIKCHYPAVFAAALLNAQPMGFYAPAQIVRDARQHGVIVHPPDINASDWDCTLTPLAADQPAPFQPALQLGLRLVDGLGEDSARRLMDARARGPFSSVEAVQHRAGLTRAQIEALANADAFGSLGLNRRQALWAAKALSTQAPLPLFAGLDGDTRPAGNPPPLFIEPTPTLPPTPPSEAVVEDYRSIGLSLKDHPLRFLRPAYRKQGIVSAAEMDAMADGAPAVVAGLVLVRQRPGTAKGVVFVTLEDETGIVNAVVWAKIMETYRPALMQARLLLIQGKVQRSDSGAVPILHLVADHLADRTQDLHTLTAWPAPSSAGTPTPSPPPRHPRAARSFPKSRDFH